MSTSLPEGERLELRLLLLVTLRVDEREGKWPPRDRPEAAGLAAIVVVVVVVVAVVSLNNGGLPSGVRHPQEGWRSGAPVSVSGLHRNR